ncbi:hypothetical protein VSX61_06175 [Brenneria populi subsp. brevivirga]|uniref:hypothetical protein n=1 Tax=Brenneria populi TaxID=1505588 RepID=UPI002E1959EC|nr:hypothetical protein [Brenneria populi subsp. brevivirga]
MRRIKQWALLGGLTLCSLAAGAAAASSGKASGIIRFTGQIVEAPCVVSTEQTMVNLSCHRDGKPVSYKYNARSPVTANNALPETIESTRLDWINPERTMSVLTITYR